MTALGLRSSARLRLSPARAAAAAAVPADAPAGPRLLVRRRGQPATADGSLARSERQRQRRRCSRTPSRRPSKTSDAAGSQPAAFRRDQRRAVGRSPPDLSGGLTLFVVYRVRTPVDFHGIVTRVGGDRHRPPAVLYLAVRTGEHSANSAVRPLDPAQPGGRAGRRFDGDAVRHRDLRRRRRRRRAARPQRHQGRCLDAVALRHAGGAGPRCPLQSGATFSFGAVDLYEVGLFNRELTPGRARPARELPAAAPCAGLEPALHRRRARLAPRRRCQQLHHGRRPDRAVGRPEHAPAPLDRQRRRASVEDRRRRRARRDQLRRRRRSAGADRAGLPTLQPFSVGLVYRVRERSDFTGILSATPPAGTDHSDFWTFRNASAASQQMQLFGRSIEADPLEPEPRRQRRRAGRDLVDRQRRRRAARRRRIGQRHLRRQLRRAHRHRPRRPLCRRALRPCRDRRARDHRRCPGAVDGRSATAGRVGHCEMEPVSG